jgi:hypothetical protein
MRSWRNATEEDVRALARAWADDVEQNVGQLIVMMNFTAPPELQWQFIVEAMLLAKTEDQLGDLAAGPMEHLLGKHGDAYIDLFESHAAADPKFAKAVRGVRKYMMSDENWRRIEAIKGRLKQ